MIIKYNKKLKTKFIENAKNVETEIRYFYLKDAPYNNLMEQIGNIIASDFPYSSFILEFDQDDTEYLKTMGENEIKVRYINFTTEDGDQICIVTINDVYLMNSDGKTTEVIK